ncbi:unnamed protein product, partial [Ectocarpus sp. 13 AM-2016]
MFPQLKQQSHQSPVCRGAKSTEEEASSKCLIETPLSNSHQRPRYSLEKRSHAHGSPGRHPTCLSPYSDRTEAIPRPASRTKETKQRSRKQIPSGFIWIASAC